MNAGDACDIAVAAAKELRSAPYARAVLQSALASAWRRLPAAQVPSVGPGAVLWR